MALCDILGEFIALFWRPCTVDEQRVKDDITDCADDGPLLDAELRCEGWELQHCDQVDVDPTGVIRDNRARTLILGDPVRAKVLLVVNLRPLVLVVEEERTDEQSRSRHEDRQVLEELALPRLQRRVGSARVSKHQYYLCDRQVQGH